MLYLTLSSTDSLAFNPENSASDFTVELPRAIEGKFTCALLDFSCTDIGEDLYIFTDICEPEYVHDAVKPLLRIVTESGEITLPHFKPVARQMIQRVHVYIRNRYFNAPTHTLIGPVRITLGLEAL